MMLTRFIADKRGIALVEFALVLPFILLLLWGSLELARFITIAQRVDKSAYALADLTSQYLPASPAARAGEISYPALQNDVFPQYRRLMSPYEDEADRVAILTSVRREGGQLLINWQVAGGGTLGGDTVRSIVNDAAPGYNTAVRGTEASFSGEAAEILSGANGMAEGESMLVAEVFFYFRPLFQNLRMGVPEHQFSLGERVLSRRMFIYPRKGDLTTMPPDFQ
jgi:hypothetical protein